MAPRNEPDLGRRSNGNRYWNRSGGSADETDGAYMKRCVYSNTNTKGNTNRRKKSPGWVGVMGVLVLVTVCCSMTRVVLAATSESEVEGQTSFGVGSGDNGDVTHLVSSVFVSWGLCGIISYRNAMNCVSMETRGVVWDRLG